MNREIKFRRAHFFDEEKTRFNHFSEWGINIDNKHGESFRSPSHNNFAIYFEDQQYTGLIDKNGTEIWEGDIVKYDDTNFGYGGQYDKDHDGYLYTFVTFEDGCFCFKDGLELYNHNKVCEVIGNIYEQPELLK
jgi:uncharacterized phage protein (TIGR01671 family)